jgi:hypothetical protein
MTNPTDTNQASEDELIYGVDTGIPGGDNTALSIKKGSTLYTFVGGEAVAIIDVIRTEKLKLLAEVRERVVGEDEKLVIPDYPKTDDEGEPLYSKRAAKEGRKQVTARYHTRKELRNDQRTELTQLEAEL